MRLIDADALKRSMAESMAVLRFNQEHDGLIAEIIDNAPTVELQMGRMTNGIIIPIERPTGEYQNRALELINTLNDENKISIRQVGTLRRAILAEPDRPTGEWINIKNRRGWLHLTCSCCSYNDVKCTLYDIPKYCPNCGAHMKGEEE